MKETYIKAFGHIFQQVKGIIMGGKISGWLSDCSLMVDEFLYIRNKMSNGLNDQAIRLKFFRRYRDDCTTLNCQNFLDIAKDIYYAAQLLFFLIGTYLPTFSSVIRHVMGLHDKFEVDRRLKSLCGLRSHME